MAKRKSTGTRKTQPRNQSAFPIVATADECLDISALETWLWDPACAIHGATDAPKLKDFILPLVLFKRLSDVFVDEFARHVEAFGGEETASEIIAADHADVLKSGRKPIVRSLSRDYRWEMLRNQPADGRLESL